MVKINRDLCIGCGECAVSYTHLRKRTDGRGRDEITANGTESRIKHGFSGTEPLGKYEYSRKYFHRQRAGRKKQAAGQGHTE